MRLKPFDTSTAGGRSRERYRRAGLTTVTSVMAKGVTVVTSLITVRLTIHYLGTERYGLWMTITSIVAFLMFADLGIGNGLLHAIADARGREDDESVHKYVSSAFFILCGVAVLLLGVFAIAYSFIPWPRVFNVSSELAAKESGPAVFVFLICFLLNLPLDVVQRVQTGHQEGFVMNLWTAIGSLTGLAGLLVAVHLHGGLPWLILAILGGQLAGVFGNWVYEFGWMRPGALSRVALLGHWRGSTHHGYGRHVFHSSGERRFYHSPRQHCPDPGPGTGGGYAIRGSHAPVYLAHHRGLDVCGSPVAGLW